MRPLLAVPAVAVALAVLPAAPAVAGCTANLQGVVASGGASHGTPAACPPQVGKPEGTGTGRKVG